MLTHLSIQNLRNLHYVSIDTTICNVFIGKNGSGKTSLLESLHLLSRGKSFRHAQPKRYISHYHPQVTVHAKFSDRGSIAVQKNRDATSIMRLDGQPVYNQSALAKRLPILLIDPSSMDILEIGSNSRRQLLDWITFHVKQGFHSQWLAYQRLLKQRNTLLKSVSKPSTIQLQELASWDEGLANHARLITHYRQTVFDTWKPRFEDLIQELLPEYAPFIKLRFLPGYDTNELLNETLKQRIVQDVQLGYTRVGCHRADVQVLWLDDRPILERHDTHNYNDSYAARNELDLGFNDERLTSSSLIKTSVREQAANVLSRGEKKLLITALRLSQLPMLTQNGHLDQYYRNSKMVFKPIVKPKMVEYTFLEQKKRNKLKNEYNSAESLPIVMLDDITAELDDRALDVLLSTLSSLNCQLFITSLNDKIINKLDKYWVTKKVFHVKQGAVSIDHVQNNAD